MRATRAVEFYAGFRPLRLLYWAVLACLAAYWYGLGGFILVTLAAADLKITIKR